MGICVWGGWGGGTVCVNSMIPLSRSPWDSVRKFINWSSLLVVFVIIVNPAGGRGFSRGILP